MLDETDTRTAELTEACMDAYRYCMQAAANRLKEEATCEAQRLGALYDCADINLALANYVSRGSRYSRHLAHLAASVSDACAETLSKGGHDDPELRATYAACLHVSQACRQYIGDEAPEFYTERDETIRESFPGSDAPPPPSKI